MFRRNILPPVSRLRTKPSMQPAEAGCKVAFYVRATCHGRVCSCALEVAINNVMTALSLVRSNFLGCWHRAVVLWLMFVGCYVWVYLAPCELSSCALEVATNNVMTALSLVRSNFLGSWHRAVVLWLLFVGCYGWVYFAPCELSLLGWQLVITYVVMAWTLTPYSLVQVYIQDDCATGIQYHDVM
jgi:hypothetical protein